MSDYIAYLPSGELACDNGASNFTWEKDPDARAELWKARHNWWYSHLAMDPGKKVSANSATYSLPI